MAHDYSEYSLNSVPDYTCIISMGLTKMAGDNFLQIRWP
jgi:hypothetical protein